MISVVGLDSLAGEMYILHFSSSLNVGIQYRHVCASSPELQVENI